MSTDEIQQPEQQPQEPIQSQPPSADPVVFTTQDSTTLNDAPVKAEEPIVAPVQGEPVVEVSPAIEQPIPEIQVTQEQTSPLMTDPSHQPLLRKEGTEEGVESTATEAIQQDRPDGESGIQPTKTLESAAPTEPTERVIEKIIEKEKPLTAETRHEVFKEELKTHLTQANKAKHERYEQHLQDIVDFIRVKATLVTNQDIEEGLKVPDATVTYRPDELIRRGVVIRIGQGFDARYRLKEAV